MHDIYMMKVVDINARQVVEELGAQNLDLIIECGWSQIISKDIIQIPLLGTLGLHYALLPKNRGGASLNWALIRDEIEWGITLYYLDEKIDKGDIIAQKRFPIFDDDDINSLYDRADNASISALLENLPLIKAGTAPRIKQDPTKSTYLKARKPEDGLINWNQPARNIYNLIRALTLPYPCAFSYLNGEKMDFVKSRIFGLVGNEASPGTIVRTIPSGLVIKCGDICILAESVIYNGDKYSREGIMNKLQIYNGIKFDSGISGKADENIFR
jgi:methionyl-tRNA formyltransferase